MHYVSCTLQEGMSIPYRFLLMLSLSELMHDVNTASAPINICNLFTKTSRVHSYNTRSSTSDNFYIKASRLEIQKYAFSRVGAKLWNEIASSLRELPKKLFKLRIKNKLLSVLEDEDSFIEVGTIISKVNSNVSSSQNSIELNYILFQFSLLLLLLLLLFLPISLNFSNNSN